jgi:putative two-component system response regulator
MIHILIVEDNPGISSVMQELLEMEGYQVTSAANGLEALELLNRATPDLVVSDIMMPKMDGFALLEAVRARPNGAGIPFLFLSARSEQAATSRARSLGADDYLFKPFAPEDLLVAVRAKLNRRRALQLLDTRLAHVQTVRMLANAVEARESYTRGHVERVQQYALQLARALGWDAEALLLCEFGALLHDVGKLTVPRSILNKRRPLTYMEWELLRRHPETGRQMLEGVDHLRGAIPYVLHHHERWNGTGYPGRLAGQDIPREGRLLAIVDAYDAMTTNRPYRLAMPVEQALDEIRKQSGIQFDPAMVEVFIQLQPLSPGALPVKLDDVPL